MYKIIISLFLLIYIVYACDTIEPSLPSNSGQATISTNYKDFKPYGFSFSQGTSIQYPNTQNIFPDFAVLVNIDLNGNVLGVFFSSVDSIRPTFNLVKQFSQNDSARVFFDNLIEAPDSNYSDLALPVIVNQIWAVKTSDNKFGKILILDTHAYTDTLDPNSPITYGEATFNWVYQPNGSRIF